MILGLLIIALALVTLALLRELRCQLHRRGNHDG